MRVLTSRLSVRSATIALVALCVAAVLAFIARALLAPPERWSDARTWGGHMPQAGAVVRVPAGRHIVLDIDPPRLAALIVDGTLTFADRDVRLEAASIVVHGTVRLGSRYHAFVRHADIVLDGDASGAGVFVVADGGRLEIDGPPRLSWTRLVQTAAVGASDVVLADAPDWHAGDRVAIAPSGFDVRETEERVVAAVDGVHVRFTEPLRFRHWGAVTDGVDERAEIGLLSHGITVASEPTQAARGFGGQVMVMRGGSLRVRGAAFDALGQTGQLGRYPIHFHLSGDEHGSFVEASSVVHSLNRCIAIHGTSGVVVRDNVAFDTFGHCYFLEDGIETDNTLEHNLGMLTRVPPAGKAILESDALPATFWVTNPQNTVRSNVAAGSEGNGFWYSLSPHPTGPSTTSAIWPRRAPLGAFAGNVAHSDEMNGLFVDILKNPPGITEAPNYSPTQTADFQKFTSYKNRRRGVWLRGTNLRLSDARIADNSIGVTFAGADAIMRDGVVVGVSENATGAPKPFDAGFPIRGFEFYDGQVGVTQTSFANFVPDAQREASALSALEFSPFFTDPTNYADGLTFRNATPVYLRPRTAHGRAAGADGYRANVFRDLDGSVTGTAGASVVLDTPLLAGSGCTERKEWNAAICTAAYGSLFVVDVGGGSAYAGPVRVALDGDPRSAIVLMGNPVEGRDAIFQTNLRAGRQYSVRFAGAFPKHVRIGLHHLPAESGVALVFPQAPADLVARRSGKLLQISPQRVPGAPFILNVPNDANAGGTVLDLCAAAAPCAG
jgi:cell migration-inducing and hyaluronan-binding protein